MQFRKVLGTVLLTLVMLISASVPIWAATAQPVELEFMVNGAWSQTVIDTIQESLRRFETQNPGYTVKVTIYKNIDQFLVRYTAGNAPDVVIVGLGSVGSFGEQGITMDLGAYIDKSGLRKQVVADMWANGTWGGKVYGVPAVEQGPRLAMVWNVDMLNEAGLAVNSNTGMTWQTFFNYADKLTKVDGSGVITRLGYDPKNGQNSRLFTIAHLWDAGTYFPYEGQPALNHPNLIKMVEMNAERIFAKYGSWKYDTGWYNYFPVGKVATLNLGIYAPGELDYRNKDLRYQISWAPSLTGKKIQQINGWLLSIPSGVKHPDMSFKLIEFLATDIQFQSDLFNRVGFLGGGMRFISKLAGDLRDPSRLWYVRSMSEADYIDAPRPDPLQSKADGFFKTAAFDVWAGKQAAPAALDNANRLMAAEMDKVGRLKK